MKEKPTVGSPFFGAFPSNCIPKAMKDVSVHFFIHRSNSCKLYQRILGTFSSYYILYFINDSLNNAVSRYATRR